MPGMTLTSEQQVVIDSTAKTVLCLAGPGAGKSATLLARIARLLRDGWPASRIVCITYTNNAANELTTRLNKMAPGTVLNFCGTLHSWIFRLLNQHGRIIGLNPPLSVVDADGERELLLSAISEISWKGSIKEIEAEVANGPDGRQKPFTKAGLVAESFYQGLARDNVLSFSMILHYGLKLLCSRSDLTGADHLMVDEIQDGSAEDWKIYYASGIENRFFVGDPNQAIYGFRGGDVRQMETVWNNIGDGRFVLSDNWRCASSICDAANRLIAHQPGRMSRQTVSRTGKTGEVRIMADGFADDAIEAHSVAISMEAMNEFNKVDFNEMAVLCRTNAIAARFREVLKAHGLPVREKTRTELPPDWPRAKATLALLANPDNDRLAYVALRLSAGQSKADEVRRRALAEYKSINDLALFLPTDFTAQDCGKALAKMGVSKASLELMGRFAVLLPPEASVADLVLAVGRETVHEAEGDGIAVKTLHGAKGAEWRAVWLPSWEQEVIPGSRKDADIEESRRLCFVGITRAAERLWISWAKVRTGQWGGPQPHTRSQFVSECMT